MGQCEAWRVSSIGDRLEDTNIVDRQVSVETKSTETRPWIAVRKRRCLRLFAPMLKIAIATMPLHSHGLGHDVQDNHHLLSQCTASSVQASNFLMPSRDMASALSSGVNT